jgi:hypothetical protein
MKTLKISDKIHAELTKVVGQLTAESCKIQTYEDAIEALLHRATLLPPELLQEIQFFLEKNKELGYITREELLKDAVRSLMEKVNRKAKVSPAFNFDT